MAPDEPPDDDRPSAGSDAEPSPDADADANRDADADSSDEPSRAPSDLRAKDLIGRTREELETELDPATMAELASWFMRPSGTELAARRGDVPDEVMAGAGAQDVDDFARLAQAMGFVEEDRSAQKAAALAAVQPIMVDLLDRHERNADRIIPIRGEPRAVIDETILPPSVLRMVPTEGGQPAIGEPRLVERSPDIDALLDRDNAPQAVLRDLNRPVEDFERRLEPAFPPPTADEDMTYAVRDALRWRPEPLPVLDKPLDLRVEWKPYHATPWADLVAQAKEAREADRKIADAQTEADAAAGIVYRW